MASPCLFSQVPNYTITKFAGGGIFKGDGGLATNAQIGPDSLALDAAKNLYVSDRGSIRKITGGIINTIAGGGIDVNGRIGDGGPAIGASFGTSSIAISSSGDIYIADSNHSRIRKVSNGIITTVAGPGPNGILGDGGPATAATLQDPVSIALDSRDNLYIADRRAGRIRKVTLDGLITTIAGGITGETWEIEVQQLMH